MATSTVPHFQEELEQLKNRLLEMGGMAEEEVRLAVKGLVDRARGMDDQGEAHRVQGSRSVSIVCQTGRKPSRP